MSSLKLLSSYAFLGLVMLLTLGAVLRCARQTRLGAQGTWGIDSCLSVHVPESAHRLAYIQSLAQGGVSWLRERNVARVEGTVSDPGQWTFNVSRTFRTLNQCGYRIVAFTHLPFAVKKNQLGDQLPTELLEVYQQGVWLGREFAGLVDAWEMVGEPDIGFCTDLPDRVAAYQKAVYLGIKAGAREAAMKAEMAPLFAAANPVPVLDSSAVKSRQRNLKAESVPLLAAAYRSPFTVHRAPLVLMGALGLPPGPWLERAAANGLLDYTDAYNFHFYGHAKNLTGVIEAHRAAIARLLKAEDEKLKPAVDQQTSSPQLSAFKSQSSVATSLPMWITECGIETVSTADFLNAERRQWQADFTVETAKRALAAPDVAMFMPFILVHEGDGFAMTLAANKPLPAWEAYARFTRENPWPTNRPLGRTDHSVSHVVLQWLPDNQTCLPYKAAGSYRFRGNAPIKGALRVYNFSDKSVTGSLITEGTNRMFSVGRGDQNGEITVPSMGIVSIPLVFTAIAAGYFRETWSAEFLPTASAHSVQSAATGSPLPGRSTVSFGLERQAVIADFIESPLPLQALDGEVIPFPTIPGQMIDARSGVWSLINGLKAKQKPISAGSVASPNSGLPETEFWVEQVTKDPFCPTGAITMVDGLPPFDFIRVQLDQPMSTVKKMQVVLVDDRGQQYMIFENYGVDYYGSRSDIWLHREGLSSGLWGTMSADYSFKPERIRQVRLGFKFANPEDRLGVKLTLLRVKR